MLFLDPIQFPNLTADPASGLAGQIYWNTTDGKFRKHNGTAWSDLDTTGGGGGGSSPLTTKGDLYGYDTADARVPVGTDGQVLTADSTDAQGVAWKTPGIPPLRTSDYTLTATTNQLPLPANTDQIRLTSNGLFDVRGIQAGVHGQQLIITTLANSARYMNENANATAVDRLVISVGGTTSAGIGISVCFIYDGTTQRWRYMWKTA